MVEKSIENGHEEEKILDLEDLRPEDFEEVVGREDIVPEEPEEFTQEPGNENEVEHLKLEIENLKNQLAASRADLYNYRQRADRDRIKTRRLIAEDKATEFLPVLDNLDRALSVPEEGLAKNVLVGVRMVRRQFLTVLESSDITIIPVENCNFDPSLHDAIETEFVDDPNLDGAILCELLCGYRTLQGMFHHSFRQR